MTKMAEEARTKYKSAGNGGGNPLMQLLEDVSPLSIKLIEQNEKERELGIQKVQEE